MLKYLRAFLVVFLVLLIDQVVKIWIKTNMTLGQEFVVFEDWFKIHFTENKGMAFGWQLGGDSGKLFLTVFRVFAVFGITLFLIYIIKRKYKPIAIFSISLVLAGALGNIIDSVFYGVLFGESTTVTKAVFLPEGGGYSKLLYGSVVDMFYFPLVDTTYPTWMPFFGGENLKFFRPVFNVADSAITVGVVLIFIFRNKFFIEKREDSETSENLQTPELS